MKGFLIWGWNCIIISRVATNPSHSAMSQWGRGLHTMPGGIDTQDHRLCLRGVLGLQMHERILDSGRGGEPIIVHLPRVPLGWLDESQPHQQLYPLGLKYLHRARQY